jgi:hypothetical protein
MIRVAALGFGLGLGLLAGCVPTVAPDTPAQRAEAVLGASLVGTAPQNLMPRIADCAANNATPREVARLQAEIDAAPNAITRRIARDIIRRGDTQACLAANGVSMVKG